MTNSVSFTAHVAGANKPKSQIALTPNGNPYKKTNICSKLGGVAGAIGAVAYLGAGGGEKYLCNGIKWGDKLFNKTMLSKCGDAGKFIAILTVTSGIIGLASALGHDLMSFFDKRANKKRAHRADAIAQQNIENAVRKALTEK